MLALQPTHYRRALWQEQQGYRLSMLALQREYAVSYHVAEQGVIA